MPDSVQIETPGDIDLRHCSRQVQKSPTHRSSRYWLTAMPLVDLDEILSDSGRAIESDQKLKSRANDSVIARFAAGTIVL
jgi:hypothetical protein